MLYRILALLILVWSCSPAPGDWDNYPEVQPFEPTLVEDSIDLEFQDYVNEFDEDMWFYQRKGRHHIAVIMVDYDLSTPDRPNVVGVCTGREVVRINRDFWIEACPEIRKALVYHELGHCVLNVNHVNMAHHIMAPALHDCEVYREHWDWQVEALFK